MARRVRQAVPSDESRAANLLMEYVTCVDLHYTATAQTGVLAPELLPVEPPHYDQARGELRYLGVLVKKLKRPADNQEKLLLCWNDQDWEELLYDPLPPDGEIDPHKRFFATIKSLNGGHANPGFVLFKTAGGEKGYWCKGPQALAHLASRGVGPPDAAEVLIFSEVRTPSRPAS